MPQPCTRRTLWASTLAKLQTWGVDTAPSGNWHLIPQEYLAGSDSPALKSSQFAMTGPLAKPLPDPVSQPAESSQSMDRDDGMDVDQQGQRNSGDSFTGSAPAAVDEDARTSTDSTGSTYSPTNSPGSTFTPSSATLSARTTPPSSQTTTTTTTPNTPPSTLAIPTTLVSAESLEFMGFRRSVSEHIMLQYVYYLSDTPQHHPATQEHVCSDHFFRKAVVAHVTSVVEPDECSVGVEADYAPLLERMGFTEQAVAKLTDASLDAWKDRYSASMMACMAVESSWSFLCGVNYELRRAEMGARMGVPVGYTGTSMPTSTTSSQGNSASSQANATADATPSADMEQLHRKTGPFNVSLAEATDYFDRIGYTVLFKGGLWGNVASTLDDGGRGLHIVGLNPRIDPSRAQDDDGHDAQYLTGHIAGGPVAKLRDYRSSMPSDLSPDRRALYMTPQLDTALAYCAMRAQCRGDARAFVHTAVMVIAMPIFLAPIALPLTTAQWQRLAMMAYGDEPEDEETRESSRVMKRCLRQFEWLQAPICAQGQGMFERRSPEVAEAPITSLRLQSRKMAEQVMIRTAGLEALERAATRKIWVQSLTME